MQSVLGSQTLVIYPSNLSTHVLSMPTLRSLANTAKRPWCALPYHRPIHLALRIAHCSTSNNYHCLNAALECAPPWPAITHHLPSHQTRVPVRGQCSPSLSTSLAQSTLNTCSVIHRIHTLQMPRFARSVSYYADNGRLDIWVRVAVYLGIIARADMRGHISISAPGCSISSRFTISYSAGIQKHHLKCFRSAFSRLRQWALQ